MLSRSIIVVVGLNYATLTTVVSTDPGTSSSGLSWKMWGNAVNGRINGTRSQIAFKGSLFDACKVCEPGIDEITLSWPDALALICGEQAITAPAQQLGTLCVASASETMEVSADVTQQCYFAVNVNVINMVNQRCQQCKQCSVEATLTLPVQSRAHTILPWQYIPPRFS